MVILARPPCRRKKRAGEPSNTEYLFRGGYSLLIVSAVRCVDGIRWWGGDDLLANSTVIYLDTLDGDDASCGGGIKDFFEDNVGPCLQEWRFFNLQGDGEVALEEV